MQKGLISDISVIDSSFPGLSDLISLSIGNPTMAKIDEVLAIYAEPNHYLLAYILNTNKPIGVIGLRIANVHGVILHLAVLPDHQRTNIGRSLVEESIKHFGLKYLEAETDDDAVKFYIKCGFTCSPCASKYKNRYICKWQ